LKGFLYLTFGMAALFSGCKEYDPCFEPAANMWSVRLGVSAEFSECHVDITHPKDEANFIVQNEEQFNTLFSCSFVNSKFSFDHYTILAGRLMTPGGGRVLKQWISQECDDIVLHVEIGWSEGKTLQGVTYAALVDKITDNRRIRFDVSVLSCPDDSDTEPETIPVSLFPTEFICSATHPELNENMLDYGFIIINNSQEFLSYFQCDGENGQQLPEIDFELNTVLAGRIVGSSTSTAVNQIVERKCDAYSYMAEILPGLTTDLTSFGIYAIVPKIPQTTTVYFDWRYIQ
jgi:hypothetical protein